MWLRAFKEPVYIWFACLMSTRWWRCVLQNMMDKMAEELGLYTQPYPCMVCPWCRRRLPWASTKSKVVDQVRQGSICVSLKSVHERGFGSTPEFWSSSHLQGNVRSVESCEEMEVSQTRCCFQLISQTYLGKLLKRTKDGYWQSTITKILGVR